MKNYSITLDENSTTYNIDIIDKNDKNIYELYFEKDYLYILTPLSLDNSSFMKILYPKKSYLLKVDKIHHHIIINLILLTLINLIIALLFSLYSLNPLRKSLLMLQEFMRDIIHDLNTPISSIMINLKMISKRSEEIEMIEQSVKMLASLHKNLDSYTSSPILLKERVSLKEIIINQSNFFISIYDYLDWNIAIEDNIEIDSNYSAMERIIYNLLNNACKYNKTDGFIKIILNQKELIIINDSYGIKNPHKIFDRFYKESDRGLGIGLHIVSKLAEELNIDINLKVEDKVVKITLLLNEVTFK
ncbi:Osmosensitive K+ channel histidine kinase kdpD [hydrothermal vent metagenome]|uniref:histidine kinase n=1 Tax=hydrothermal vent metagenome TaxID=652676 RepID=A0A1W1EHM2_9ZZZZ